jgi:hypothetical protein
LWESFSGIRLRLRIEWKNNMADSASPPDIEDVLSSIRRLVSHDGGRKAADEGASAEAEEPKSKLVLTPALRVESDGDVVDAPEIADAPHVLLPDGEAADLMSPDVPLAFTSARAAKDKAEGVEPALVLEDPVDLPDEAEAIGEQDQAETVAAEEQSTTDEADVAEDAPDDNAPTSHETLTAKIAALEEVIGREPDQWEPESEGLGENAGTDVDALPWEDHVDDPVAEDDVAVAAPDPEEVAQDAEVDENADADLDLSDMGDTILDEAMLRDLISTIVREELQGALGERITRNVRKLVRREIHRAISAQDFN